MEEKRIFAKGVCFWKIFLIFVIGCIIGAYYEELLTMVKGLIKTGKLLWEPRRGVIYGPFSPVYGIGAVLMTLTLCKKRRPWYQTLFYGALLGGSFEYMINLLQEIFTGTVSWDYSKQFLSINGRTTIPIMCFWGICTLVYTDFFYPNISNLIETIPYKIGMILSTLLLIFLFFDLLISWSAIVRQSLRREGIKPLTPIGVVLDHFYPDSYLKKCFPNMQISKSKKEDGRKIHDNKYN